MATAISYDGDRRQLRWRPPSGVLATAIRFVEYRRKRMRSAFADIFAAREKKEVEDEISFDLF